MFDTESVALQFWSKLQSLYSDFYYCELGSCDSTREKGVDWINVAQHRKNGGLLLMWCEHLGSIEFVKTLDSLKIY
jgi:hypothetical protein